MGLIQSIKKRDGRIVSFNPEKISVAVEKAFTNVRGGIEGPHLQTITVEVVGRLEKEAGNGVVSIENVQNHVEQVLMEQGFYDVAKHYILYRYEHAKIREQKPQTFQVSVVKRSGASEPFSIDKLRKRKRLRYFRCSCP